MNKLTEIDREIAKVLSMMVLEIPWEDKEADFDFITLYMKSAKEIRDKLDKLGVVIKVEKELPEDWYNDFLDRKRLEKDLKDAGYVAVEPLIEEVKDGVQN